MSMTRLARCGSPGGTSVVMRSIRSTTRALPCAVLLITVTGAGVAAETGPAVHGFGESLSACAARVLPEQTLMQKQSVAVISEQGWTRKSVRRMYWKRFSDDTAKMLFEVEQPISEAGLKVLIIKQRGADPVLYVYTPDTGRARRMVGSGASNSVLGTDLTLSLIHI